MKVAILGAGAMGALVGSGFQKGGADVWLVDPFREHMDKIKNEGLKIHLNGGEKEECVKMNTATDPTQVGICDVVVILVKGMHTRSAVENANALFDNNTFVITLQNGVGNADILAEIFDAKRVGYGVLNLASVLVSPGEINANYKNNIENVFNIYFNSISDERLEICNQLVDILTAGGFKTIYSTEADIFIWQKLIVNCCVNLTCAITKLTMGQIFEQPDGRELQRQIVRELVEVANAKGIPFDYEKEWYHWEFESLPAAKAHYPSAAQDVFNSRKTEIDFLNGAISREGDKYGIDTPVNDTIVMLTHIIENTYDIQYPKK
jgi:2-dehydropantoate 2-reductase